VLVLHAVGVLACVYHLANGLWTMGITWGVWTSPNAQRWAGFPCAALGLALAVAGMGALIKMETIELPTTEARAGSTSELIAGWSEMGMWLPDQEQIKFLDQHFETAREPLCNALSHSDDSVRMRAAYVIAEIGQHAKAAGPRLLARFKNEPDELVRMYIVDALNAIDFNSDATVSVLTERLDSLDSTNVAPNADHSYAEVDERITIAAALYALTDDDTKKQYLTFVTDWLKPPPHDLRDSLLEGYWERRWIAVNSLERMPGAVEAIPMLESLRDEPDAKAWVDVHVPRVLAALRENRAR